MFSSLLGQEIREFPKRYTDLPDMEDWKMEMFATAFGNMNDNRETFQDRDDYSESVREGRRRWLPIAGAQYQAAIAAACGGGGGDAQVLQKPLRALHLKAEL
jgi:hypothetical protein